MPANSSKPKKQSLGSALGLKEPGGIMSLLTESGVPGSPLSGARDLPLTLIDHNPYQARQAFNPHSLEELANSIREQGVIEPIIVRPAGARFEIVAGERRYRASLMAEQTTIPARIMELDDERAALITTLENLQREDLDIEDEARQFAYVLEKTGMSQRQLAKMLGKDHLYVARRVKLLKRPDLMAEYRAGRMRLHEAVSLVDMDEDGSRGTNIEEEDDSTGSPGTTDDVEQGSFELVEREDLPGYIVKRGSARKENAGTTNKGAARFRWRPLQQFHTWVERTHIKDVPPDERASVRAQLTQIKEALEKQLTELELLEHEGTAPEGSSDVG